MPYIRYKIGLDMAVYAVFDVQNDDPWDYHTMFPESLIACFGGYENALRIQPLWGM